MYMYGVDTSSNLHLHIVYIRIRRDRYQGQGPLINVNTREKYLDLFEFICGGML